MQVPAVPGTASNESSEFRVDSAKHEDYRGTAEHVESNVTDALAVKLRQFDEWTVDTEAESSARAAKSGAAESGKGPSTGSGSGGAEGAAPSGQASESFGSQAADDPATGASPESESPSPTSSTPTDSSPVAAQRAASRPPHEDSSSPPQPLPRADRASEEDDVARMIREAAEQETDPERKRALMEQYDAYMENQ